MVPSAAPPLLPHEKTFSLPCCNKKPIKNIFKRPHWQYFGDKEGCDFSRTLMISKIRTSWLLQTVLARCCCSWLCVSRGRNPCGQLWQLRPQFFRVTEGLVGAKSSRQHWQHIFDQQFCLVVMLLVITHTLSPRDYFSHPHRCTDSHLQSPEWSLKQLNVLIMKIHQMTTWKQCDSVEGGLRD